MHRDLKRMASVEHDVVVVGGGIHGACAAWEATRRGLRVALVEADDFGHATTSNSLRTFHGGLRYLQQLDFKRMRESIRERREWLRVARDVVKPMRFVLPTSGYGLRGPAALYVALAANDLVSCDRNDGVWADRHLPRGEVWRARRARQIFAGTNIPRINGAARIAISSRSVFRQMASCQTAAPLMRGMLVPAKIWRARRALQTSPRGR